MPLTFPRREVYGVTRPGPQNPALDSLRDDVREFLEFNGTAVERLGERLGDTEQALARGELGTALHLLRQAKTTQAVIAKGFARANADLLQR